MMNDDVEYGCKVFTVRMNRIKDNFILQIQNQLPKLVWLSCMRVCGLQRFCTKTVFQLHSALVRVKLSCLNKTTADR